MSLIREINNQLNENFVDIEIKMVLQQIVNDGKITNGAQTSVLVNMMELDETGRIGTLSNFDDAPQKSAELVAKIKSMSDADVAELARRYLDILNKKDAANRGDIKTSKDEKPGVAHYLRSVVRGNH